MINVYNEYEVFYLYEIQTETWSLIGNEKELIVFLAKGYYEFYNYCKTELRNRYFDNFGCNQNETDKWYQFFNGTDRCINPKIYEVDARNYFLKKLKGKSEQFSHRYVHKYKGIFRRTPVEGIRKIRGGSSHKMPKTKRIFAMYANPEYKDFNRGTKKLIPSWWDDKFRHVEMNWKSQRKTRHQWKE